MPYPFIEYEVLTSRDINNILAALGATPVISSTAFTPSVSGLTGAGLTLERCGGIVVSSGYLEPKTASPAGQAITTSFVTMGSIAVGFRPKRTVRFWVRSWGSAPDIQVSISSGGTVSMRAPTAFTLTTASAHEWSGAAWSTPLVVPTA